MSHCLTDLDLAAAKIIWRSTAHKQFDVQNFAQDAHHDGDEEGSRKDI